MGSVSLAPVKVQRDCSRREHGLSPWPGRGRPLIQSKEEKGTGAVASIPFVANLGIRQSQTRRRSPQPLARIVWPGGRLECDVLNSPELKGSNAKLKDEDRSRILER